MNSDPADSPGGPCRRGFAASLCAVLESKKVRLVLAYVFSLGIMLLALSWVILSKKHSREVLVANSSWLPAPESHAPTYLERDLAPVKVEPSLRLKAAAKTESPDPPKAAPAASPVDKVAEEQSADAKKDGGQRRRIGDTQERDSAGSEGSASTWSSEGGERPLMEPMASPSDSQAGWRSGGDGMRTLRPAPVRGPTRTQAAGGASPASGKEAGDRFWNKPVANRQSAGSASPSAGKYAPGSQAPALAPTGNSIVGGFPQGTSQGARSDPVESAAKGGAAKADAPTGANAPTELIPVEYSYGSDAKHKCDFYQGSRNPAPIAVYFHGGAFVAGDKGEAKNYVTLLSRGYAMASCNYRLLQNPTAAAQDGRSAMRWFKDNAGMLNIDPKKVVAVGASAGGYIAAMLGSAGDADPIQAVIDLAGPTDFGPGSNSPMQYVSGNDPPTFVRHGRDDAVVSYTHSANYCAKMKSAGIKTDCKIVEGVSHTIPPALREQLIKESLDFLDTVIPK